MSLSITADQTPPTVLTASFGFRLSFSVTWSFNGSPLSNNYIVTQPTSSVYSSTISYTDNAVLPCGSYVATSIVDTITYTATYNIQCMDVATNSITLGTNGIPSGLTGFNNKKSCNNCCNNFNDF
jgi:hypothetical protein